ncbi:MAG: glycosyltransferase family 4 protein [Kiritimatiellae bacterium]|nr:glycosyltransferase family 4 protein [Kiritimatiellia bacterium]
MKLAFVIDNPRIIGGGDYALYKYAEALSRMGHVVTVHGQFFNEFMDGIRGGPDFSIRLRGGLFPGLRGVGRVNRLWNRVHTRIRVLPTLTSPRSRPDWVIGYHRDSAVKAVRLGRAANVPVANVVFESPEWISRTLGERYGRIDQDALKRKWEIVRDAYRASDVLLPLTGAVREEVAAWTGCAVAPPIYCGVDDPMFTPDDSAGNHLLYVGRLNVTKNVHEFIDAASLVHGCPRLVIVGSGHEESDLRRRAIERGVDCEFVGHVTDAEKWNLIRHCRFMVFPTSFEGFGIPPAEALMCGKPCICSDIPILREVYQDTVEWFPEHDVDALAGKIRWLLDHPDLGVERGRSGRAFVKQHYSWEKSARRIENALADAGRALNP